MAAVRICCVSDTHGDEAGLGQLPRADVLLHGGDFTLFGREKHVQQFDSWGAAQPQPRECKVLVLGNRILVIGAGIPLILILLVLLC